MPDAETPEVITPLESSYIRALLPTILPAINWIIYATNLDVKLHITKLTTDQLWQGINAGLMVLGVVLVIVRRVKDGRDPNSTAAEIVLRKPDPPPEKEFTSIAIDVESPPPPHTKSPEELLEDYKRRMKAIREP